MIRWPIPTEQEDDPEIDALDKETDRIYADARRHRHSADAIAERAFDMSQDDDRLMEALSLIAANRDADALRVLSDLIDEAVVSIAKDKISSAREYA